MSDRALRFSRLGDASFDRLAARFSAARRFRLLLEQPLARERHARIRAAALDYVAASLGVPGAAPAEEELCARLEAARGAVRNHDAGGPLLPKRELALEFGRLHAAVAAQFSDWGLDDLIETIDLPFNVRMVYGRSDPAKARLPFSSAKPHSDVWAGVPYDAVVVVLPLLGDIEHITIECGEMARERELEWMRALPDYADGDARKVVAYDAPMRHGHVYFGDARNLHQTVRRRKDGVRLSLDFRFRMRDLDGYRSFLPPVRGGPDAMDRTVAYPDWLAVGSRTLLTFPDSLDDPPRGSDGAPTAGVAYRAVELWPAGPRSGAARAA